MKALCILVHSFINCEKSQILHNDETIYPKNKKIENKKNIQLFVFEWL